MEGACLLASCRGFFDVTHVVILAGRFRSAHTKEIRHVGGLVSLGGLDMALERSGVREGLASGQSATVCLASMLLVAVPLELFTVPETVTTVITCLNGQRWDR